MGRKLTFDETLALQLYHEHKSDAEIAKELGVLMLTFRGWRQRKGLKMIYRAPEVKQRKEYIVGCDYRKALNPEQAKEMKLFLHTILRVSDKAKEAGIKPNVGDFINAWRGPVSRGETA